MIASGFLPAGLGTASTVGRQWLNKAGIPAVDGTVTTRCSGLGSAVVNSGTRPHILLVENNAGDANAVREALQVLQDPADLVVLSGGWWRPQEFAHLRVADPQSVVLR